VDTYKEIRKIAGAALHRREARLQGRLAALQAEAVLRVQEDARQWRQVPEPTIAAGRHGALSFRHDVFWLKQGEIDAGPLCPSCWGRERSAVLMRVGAVVWSCPACHRVARMPVLS
jgi:ribosomal protein L37AE/L43A